MIKVFKNTGTDFSACYAAQNFIKQLGYSCNSMERHNPIAISKEYIGKWRHLDDTDRAELVGVYKGDWRNGDVEVTIFDDVDKNPYLKGE